VLSRFQPREREREREGMLKESVRSETGFLLSLCSLVTEHCKREREEWEMGSGWKESAKDGLSRCGKGTAEEAEEEQEE